jgi:hypothetical protein
MVHTIQDLVTISECSDDNAEDEKKKIPYLHPTSTPTPRPAMPLPVSKSGLTISSGNRELAQK